MIFYKIYVIVYNFFNTANQKHLILFDKLLKMQFKSIAVFCGSKSGVNPLFVAHAKQLGQLFAKHNITMIYGGGSVGLMGAVANEMMENGGEVIGVIPEILVAREQQHKGISKLHVVPDMHVRKRMMYEMCDAVIVLPGGYGTLDELFEVITWNNLKIHEKKIILLNSAGFYTHLIEHLRVMQQEGYLYENWEDKISVVDEPKAIFSF